MLFNQIIASSFYLFLGNGALQVPQITYVSSDITNRAGRRLSIVWRDDIIEMDIADGATVQLRYKIQSYMNPPPVYKLFPVRYGTNITDLINKDTVMIVPAANAPTVITSAICSSSKLNHSIARSVDELIS